MKAYLLGIAGMKIWDRMDRKFVKAIDMQHLTTQKNRRIWDKIGY